MSAGPPPSAGEDGAEARRTVQATSVAIGDFGVLLLGPPGSGKSDLALRLIDGGAELVADDLTLVTRTGDVLTAWLPDGAPAELRGRLEIRGIGLVAMPVRDSVRLALAVEMVAQEAMERLPPPRRFPCLGLALPLIAIDPRAPSAAARLRLVARSGPDAIMPPR